ncbi:hypothetical protein TOK_3113 [Pseudonocardia sp. N23]|nr:hypothetical protein TOK_3113 [Pseudonocardia sp. N23]
MAPVVHRLPALSTDLRDFAGVTHLPRRWFTRRTGERFPELPRHSGTAA